MTIRKYTQVNCAYFDTSYALRRGSSLLAEGGQTQFPTPLPISNANKVNVYRNGVLINFTAIDVNTIQVEAAATCYKNDEIRIVQFY